MSRCSAGYSDPCSTCNTSSDLNSMPFAMACPVRRSQQQRPDNQQVQRPLQQFDAFAFFFSRHSR